MSLYILFFFFNDTATTEIYTLSLHDALPISSAGTGGRAIHGAVGVSIGAQAAATAASITPATRLRLLNMLGIDPPGSTPSVVLREQSQLMREAAPGRECFIRGRAGAGP